MRLTPSQRQMLEDIETTGKAEALSKLRKAEHGKMLDSTVDHTGVATVELMPDAH
jgi:hypothetical protein